jgi:hypothetical protein
MSFGILGGDSGGTCKIPLSEREWGNRRREVYECGIKFGRSTNRCSFPWERRPENRLPIAAAGERGAAIGRETHAGDFLAVSGKG